MCAQFLRKGFVSSRLKYGLHDSVGIDEWMWSGIQESSRHKCFIDELVKCQIHKYNSSTTDVVAKEGCIM